VVDLPAHRDTLHLEGDGGADAGQPEEAKGWVAQDGVLDVLWIGRHGPSGSVRIDWQIRL